MFVIGVNSLIGMSLRGSPGSRRANADNAILAFTTPELLVILSSAFSRLTANVNRIRLVHTRCVRWQCGIPGCGPYLQQAL